MTIHRADPHTQGESPMLVAVTAGTGYVASHPVRALLLRGPGRSLS